MKQGKGCLMFKNMIIDCIARKFQLPGNFIFSPMKLVNHIIMHISIK